jgi:hypothetical protein
MNLRRGIANVLKNPQFVMPAGLHHFERKLVNPQKRAFNRFSKFYQCGEKSDC